MNETTLPALHHSQAERFGPRVALRFKQHGLYHDVTWNEFHEEVSACAAALVETGIRPGDRVGILSENRPEWLVADMGLLCAGAINVPLHAPLSARQAHFQLADAGVRSLFVSTPAQYEKVRQLRGELPELQDVVLFEGSAMDGRALSWTGFLQKGRCASTSIRQACAERRASLGPLDLATIIYTSGTTGNPKGVMLTHDNLLSNVRAFYQSSPFPPDAALLSWLPFSHIYARTVDIYGSLLSGVPLCLAESADTLVLNLAEIGPTNMAGVPRFYEKVLAAVHATTPEETQRRLRGIFGPRIDWLNAGGAPTPLAVSRAYHEAGLLLLQGYGLTESSPVISFNRKDAYKLDSVGQAIPGVEVRIAADGEILTRGPHVMKGYWNNPEATAEAIEGGWLHTGDLGRLDGDGFLYVTGRKKELLVLSNGKKVVPSYLEGLLLADPCIDQIVVCGEGRNYLCALLVPHWPNLCRELALDQARGEESLAGEIRVKEALAKRACQALAEVSAWEQVRKLIVLPRPFSVAAEELTVSLKLRRSVITQKHRAAIDALYEEG